MERKPLLVVTMLKNYTIEIGDSVRITVLSVSEDEVRLCIEDPMASPRPSPQASNNDTELASRRI